MSLKNGIGFVLRDSFRKAGLGTSSVVHTATTRGSILLNIGKWEYFSLTSNDVFPIFGYVLQNQNAEIDFVEIVWNCILNGFAHLQRKGSE